MNIKKISSLSMLTTFALIIYSIENTLPPLVPIPGIKLGLANIITLIVLLNFTGKDAFLVLIMRILLSTFILGQTLSFFYSLLGGILGFLIMYILNYLFKNDYIFITSIFGALFHNIGQIMIAVIITKSLAVFSYLPFLIISGFITGLFIGLCAHYSQKYLLKLR